MPRRSLLTQAERDGLLAYPTDDVDLIRYYTLSDQDLRVISERRGGHNRLGFAAHLCALRYPGQGIPADGAPPRPFLTFIAAQLGVDSAAWDDYATRAETRREHLLELQATFDFYPFTGTHYHRQVEVLSNLALQTDKGIVLATALVHTLRVQQVIIPPLAVVERVCAEAMTRGTRRVYQTLTDPLTPEQCSQLDGLLEVGEDTQISPLAWLRQPPGGPGARSILTHIKRLHVVRAVGVPNGLERALHQNRLLKLAREGAQMTAQHLRDLEPLRRHATVVAILLDTRATLTDEIIDLYDRSIGVLFNRAKRAQADEVQHAGKAINDKVRLFYRVGRALVDAKDTGRDPFAAIEAIIPWETFAKSVSDAEQLAQPEDFDYLHRLGDGYTHVRRYAPEVLAALDLTAAPAARDILSAVNLLKTMNETQARKVPEDAPTGFIRKRWVGHVFVDAGIDRRFYELCALSELKNALRSGDIWAQGSRQFKDFEDYLLPTDRFAALRNQHGLPLPINPTCEGYLGERLDLLRQELQTVGVLAQANTLPDATITEAGLKMTPLVSAVPDAADDLLRRASALLPRIKITDLLLEIDEWTGFTRHFTHLKSGDTAVDRTLVLTAILADAINLGLVKMAESCPGTTTARLSWVQAWYIRDETYAAALAEVVNTQSHHPFAVHWGDGMTSSSDGQHFRVGGRGTAAGQVNAKYGNDPSVVFYTHISDQYAPFHTQVINATMRDATYVLDGLLYHESDLRIEEHYTDTAGFTDHVFALTHLLGFRFAPRIRDLADKRLYVPGDTKAYPSLSPLIGGTLNLTVMRLHWEEILRLATSISQGTVTASLMLRKLGSYPRQNGLAVALRELGRIERTLFTLEWLQDPGLRRRVQVGLNKGEARNALARAVAFNRLGEIRDRSFDNQRYRASGLNLVVAAITLWNTVYLERSIDALRAHGYPVDDNLLPHLSPLGWEHVGLTGDYVWQHNAKIKKDTFRPLRPIRSP